MLRLLLVVLLAVPTGMVSKDYDGSNPQLEEWIASTWPVELVDDAIDVAWCESRGKPGAVNGRYGGLFQIGPTEWRKFGRGNRFDPIDNSAAAYRYYQYSAKYTGNGWRPWQCRPA